MVKAEEAKGDTLLFAVLNDPSLQVTVAFGNKKVMTDRSRYVSTKIMPGSK